MHFTSDTTRDGVREQLFDLDGLPGALWTPAGAGGPRPLILIGHGGGEHRTAPDVLHRAHRFVTDGGFAVACADVPNHGDRPTDDHLDALAADLQGRVEAGEDRSVLLAHFQAHVARQTVGEWQKLLDAVQQLDHVGAGPAGYWGVCLGCGLGVPFVAAEPRIHAAVLGLGGAAASAQTAAQITVPVEFLIQWNDERVPRDQSLALFNALASTEKTLHANPGGHGETPAFETDSSVRFFSRHLGTGSRVR
jgi:dienelactone hydrolase